MSWFENRGTDRDQQAGTRAEADAESGTGLLPSGPLITAESRLMLSPVPALQAKSQDSGPASPKTGASANTITLYPVEPVPSHLLCAICTLPYENPVHFLPCCHVFCLECIQLWIGMNFGDDLLQNELRRAYPAESDREFLNNPSTIDQDGLLSMHPHQQQFMFELARMGDSRQRSGTTSSMRSVYDSFSHLTAPQQQFLQQQHHQQRVAALLESRDMPKCPMCRTGLHITSWDRIEEQIKVPVTVSAHRPGMSSRSGENPSLSQPSGYLDHRANSRPSGRDRGSAIGDLDEEIEMEQVGGHQRIRQTSSSSTLPVSRRPTRPERTHSPRLFLPGDISLLQRDGMDPNDDDEPQTPATAVIGRRPSEWMRYQQRQLQANQQQLQSIQQRNNPLSEPEQHNAVPPNTDAHDERQELIRRLQREQDSQEERLRALTAQAASVRNEEAALRRQLLEVAPTSLAADMSSFERDSSDANNTSTGESDSDQREGETGAMTRTSQRQSALQIDTSATRPSSSGHNRLSRTSTRRRSVQSSHQDLRPESMLSSSTTVRNLNGDGIPSPAAIVEGNSDSGSNGEGNDSDDTDNNSIMEAIQQGTRAWARRASELSLGLNVGREPRDLEMEDGSDESALNSALDSARPPFGSQGSDHPFSPSLESNLSYGTSSTFSHSNTVFNTASTEVSFSQRSSSIQQWEQHSLALQMPTMDGGQTAFSDSESLFDQDILADNNPDQEEYSGRPWNEVSPEEDNKALDACHHRMSLRGEHPESASESQKSLSKDVITKLEEGIRNGSCATTTESSHIKDGASGSQSSVQENRSNSLRSSLQESDSSSSSSSSSSSNNHSVSALLQSSEQAWKSESPSGISPLLNELDIHYPIANVGLEESLTPTTRMAIGAEASRMHERSVSVSMSEDGDDRDQGDLRMVRENPSPVDSPIPTPSTARPRRRFPAGVSLINSESDDEADEVDEDIDEMDDGTDEQGGLREEEPTVGEIVQSVESPGSRVQSSRHSSSITRAAPMIQEEALSEPGQRGSMAADPEVNDDSADAQTPRNTTGQGAMPSMLAQDPLSATEIDVAQERHNTTEARGIEDHELDTSQLIIPLVRPQRTSLSSPPPLPLPLPVAVTRQGLYTSTAFTAGMEGVTVRDHQSGSMLTRTEPSNPEPRVSNSSYGLPHEVLAQQHEAFAVARHTLDVLRMRSEDVDGASDDGEEETRTGEQSRLEELVQYRTLVRYQPKLPKAHVMSDLISQIRVDCPQKEYGCQEIMELQQALQHGRDVCQHRMVMCPRARCGLWMRVDQILEHILLVDPTSFASNVPLSTLSRESGSGGLVGSAGHDSGMHRSSPSSVDTLSSRQGDNSTSRGPRFGHGPRGAGRPGIASPRSTGSAGVAINSSTNANTHHHHGGEAQSQTQAQQSLSSVNSGIPPCPGLTWEREQLARATGIIGQLTEENSSLRQMIRQLTAQNAKLMKDKDRWQRYANLGLGRDI